MSFKLSDLKNTFKRNSSKFISTNINSNNIISTNFKRRKFFFFLSTGALGVMFLSKLNFLKHITKNNINNQTINKIKIVPNPFAVKRNVKIFSNTPKGNLNG